MRLQARARTARRPADDPDPAAAPRAAGRHRDRRRRRRVAAGRRPGAGRDHRLLHPARRRRPHLGPDRRAERRLGRLRDGRAAAVRAQPGGLAVGGAAGLECSPRCSPAARRSARRAGSPSSAGTAWTTPSPSTGWRSSARCTRTGSCTNAGLRDGDALVLTKPLGIGIATTAIKAGVAPGELVDAAVASMTASNAAAAAGGGGRRGDGLHRRHRVRAARAPGEDGRGVRASTPSIDVAAVPVLPGVRELAAVGDRARRQPPQPRLGGAARWTPAGSASSTCCCWPTPRPPAACCSARSRRRARAAVAELADAGVSGGGDRRGARGDGPDHAALAGTADAAAGRCSKVALLQRDWSRATLLQSRRPPSSTLLGVSLRLIRLLA